MAGGTRTVLRQATGGFELVKWYLDAVEPDGSAIIAYWASLAWHGVRVHWHDAARYPLGQPRLERSSMRQVPAPTVTDADVTWSSPHLGIETRHASMTPAVTLTLLDDASGRITWECVAPSARARIDHGGTVVEGTGYAERITMTVPPTALPLDELRWGRWMSDDATASLAWIDWRGAAPRHWVVRNGVPEEPATVGEDGIQTDAGRLALGSPRTLHQRSVGRLLRGLSGLAQVAARIPIAWEEHKLCCRAEWVDASGARAAGWAIHEIVSLG